MITKTIILSLAIWISVVNCAPNDEVAAEVFVKETNDKVMDLLNEYSDKLFDSTDLETGNETFSKNFFDENIQYAAHMITQSEIVMNNIIDLCDRAAEFNYNKFKNQDLKTALQHIHLWDSHYLNKQRDVRRTIQSTANICLFQNKTNCDLTIDDVSEIIRESNDPEEWKYYWNEWRFKNQALLKEYLSRTVEVIKSKSNSHKVSPSMFLFKDYHDEHFIDEMEKVVTEIQPLYQQLHATVRLLLIEIYGADVIPKSGLIPAHLFEKFLLFEKNVINMEEVFEEKNITAFKIIHFANDFFHKMGLDELPKEFWEKRVKVIEDDVDDLNCYAAINDLSPHIFLKYCKHVHKNTFLQAYGLIARIYYANQKKNIPFAFFESYNLEFGVAEAAILSATSTKHLDSLGLIKDTIYADSNFEMARLLHLSIDTVVNIPIYYVYTKIINDLVSENVKFDDVNTHYWTLMKKYVGVSPPSPINGDVIAFPYNFYMLSSEDWVNIEFHSKVIGYQIYESLCNKSGHKIDLHKCDFSESTEAGEALKEMMSMGSKKPWREVLSIVTGTTTGLSGKPIINFFSTYQKHILKRISELGATVGWV